MTASNRTVVKIRITADSETAATDAVSAVEAALARYGCKIARPRQGSNPKYASDPKWLAYGDMVLGGSPPQRRPRRKPATATQKPLLLPNGKQGENTKS